MATTDYLISLAERIAQNLRGVSRNEWMKWIHIVESARGNVTRGIHYAQRMSQDPTIRPNIQRIHRTIAQTLPRYRTNLERLTPQERRRVFGYISWLLKIQEANRQGGRSHGPKHSPRHPGHFSRGGYRGR